MTAPLLEASGSLRRGFPNKLRLSRFQIRSHQRKSHASSAVQPCAPPVAFGSFYRVGSAPRRGLIKCHSSLSLVPLVPLCLLRPTWASQSFPSFILNRRIWLKTSVIPSSSALQSPGKSNLGIADSVTLVPSEPFDLLGNRIEWIGPHGNFLESVLPSLVIALCIRRH